MYPVQAATSIRVAERSTLGGMFKSLAHIASKAVRVPMTADEFSKFLTV